MKIEILSFAQYKDSLGCSLESITEGGVERMYRVYLVNMSQRLASFVGSHLAYREQARTHDDIRQSDLPSPKPIELDELFDFVITLKTMAKAVTI